MYMFAHVYIMLQWSCTVVHTSQHIHTTETVNCIAYLVDMFLMFTQTAVSTCYCFFIILFIILVILLFNAAVVCPAVQLAWVIDHLDLD